MDTPMEPRPRIAVLIPCHNEAAAIGRVVASFREALPEAVIHVYDNNSTDGTAEAARAAGARVGREACQGKGHVVRRMFADVEADVYLMVDGDGTYDAASAPLLVRTLREGRLDMVVGSRVETALEAYRPGHRVGNRLLTGSVRLLFGRRFTDILSGYRAFSRRFVKSFPVLSAGFEIETELTVHALELSMPVEEVPAPYGARAEGTQSKLRTWSDGLRILRLIASLYRNEKPLQFFSILSGLVAAASLALAVPLFVTYARTGLVPRFPTAILCAGMMTISALGLACGLVLDTVTRGRREMKKLAYLAVAAPGDGR
ncbi:glycosyltransferase [Mesoterricola sediminis]|uniref:Glycosyl transferase n=1 Tax=Mesoterricola sediminis TaxID=2927980 RepID=A0AA48GUZ4_9BACT|nr:glycosyltransferase [Mesoterricola sediminis]BDU78279.1 glycosyl transferase [Mesoterricola sediminis]